MNCPALVASTHPPITKHQISKTHPRTQITLRRGKKANQFIDWVIFPPTYQGLLYLAACLCFVCVPLVLKVAGDWKWKCDVRCRLAGVGESQWVGLGVLVLFYFTFIYLFIYFLDCFIDWGIFLVVLLWYYFIIIIILFHISCLTSAYILRAVFIEIRVELKFQIFVELAVLYHTIPYHTNKTRINTHTKPDKTNTPREIHACAQLNPPNKLTRPRWTA